MRVTAVVLALVLGVLAAGCGGEEERGPGTTASPAAAAAPPAAAISAGGDPVAAGVGSYCWANDGAAAACADMVAPACDDGRTPTVQAQAGSAIRIALPFEPGEAPVLMLGPGDADGRTVALARSRAPRWIVDLVPGLHAIALLVRRAGVGDVHYTACLDVQAGRLAPELPASPPSATVASPSGELTAATGSAPVGRPRVGRHAVCRDVRP
jgi:hypothetical protein